MQIVKRTLAMLMVCAMVLACLPAVGLTALAEETTAATHQTLLWDAGSGAEAFTSPYIATNTGRNTPSISREYLKGVNRQSALAYVQETLDGTGAAMTNIVGFNSADSLTANGFNTAATVQADDDIIWFWVDSDMTNDMRLQVTINGGQVGKGAVDGDADGDGTNDYCSTVYVYTIEKNAETGAPEMVKVYRQGHDAVITGLGLVDTKADLSGSYSQLKFADGWSGWVGIPCNMITQGKTVKTGASLTSLTLFMRMYQKQDGTYASQQAGEGMYFDEFWLTSAGTMPALTNAELLYKEPVQISIWNQENNSKELNISKTADNRNDSLMTEVYGYGVNGSTAMKYEATEAGAVSGTQKHSDGTVFQRSITQTNANLAWASYGGTNAVANAGDIFWMWVDADWSTTQRFTFQLMGNDVAVQSEGETYIYTIVKKDGAPAIEKVLYSPDHHNPIDSVDGLDLVNSNLTNTAATTQIRLAKDFSGWIGIPVDLLKDSNTIIGTELTKFSLMLNQYSCEDPIANQQVGDAIYIDEFWLTSAGVMPDLSDGELLYVPHQTPIWDQENNTKEVNISRTANETRNDSLTTDVEDRGVLGSMALKYEATEAGSITETKTDAAGNAVVRSITQTLSNLDWTGYGGSSATVNAGDIFWLWVDADWSTTQRFTFQLMGKDVAVQTSGETYIYTIVEKDGAPAIEKVLYSPDYTAPVDAVEGLDLVNATPYNQTSKSTQIRLAKNFSGWIGIPVDLLTDSDTIIGAELTKFSLMLNQYSCEDPIENQQVGDAIYMDEFWLTAAGKMPALSDEALLYTCDGVVGFDGRYEDGMIFQQNEAWMISGIGEANQTVTVNLVNASGETVQTASCPVTNGVWSVTMEPVAGSYEVYSVQASSGTKVYTIENVVFGEVWVAAGQSNMDYTINQTMGNVNDDYAPAIAEAFGSIIDAEELQARLAAEGSNAQFIRMYLQDTVAADMEAEHTDATGRWTNGAVWEDVLISSALAFYYAEQLQQKLDVPVGIIETPKGGTSITTWLDEDVLLQKNADGSYKYQQMYDIAQTAASFTSTSAAHHVGGYFNSRIAPFQGYQVKGVLWYQGENDRNQPVMQKYGPEVLVESWSKVFTLDADASDTALDFVVFQIAPFAGYDSKGVYPDADLMDNTALNAAMREGFGKVQAKGGNVVIIPIYDLSAVLDNHHPLNKLAVATRAMQVVSETYYADAANVYSGPAVISVEYQDGKIVLTFDQDVQYIQLTETENQRITPEGTYQLPSAEELWGDKLNGFSIYTGTGYVSVETAVIIGTNQVELTVPAEVDVVAGVAYAYGLEVLSANLYDADGLPALPFLLVKEDYVPQAVQTPVWNLEELEADTTVGTVEDDAACHDVKSSVVENAGVQDSKALAITLTNLISGKTASEIVTIDLAQYGFDTTVQTMSDQLLWFYMDSDLSADTRVHILLNGLRMRGVEGSAIYTIAADENGDPAIVEVPWQFNDMEGDTDGIDGISFVHYLTSNGNTNSFARVKVSGGWSGWVGVPVNYFREAGTWLKDGDAIKKLELQLYKNGNEAYDAGTLENGDALYLDEFWVTSLGAMPNLSNEALLYTESVDPETVVDIEKWNLVLDDAIGVNFYAKVPAECLNNTQFNITVDGNTTSIQAVDAPEVDGNRVVSVEVAAAQMMDTITVEMVFGNQTVTKTYTVRGYADEILGGNYDEITKDLVRNMLNYGAKAQTYFNHNADNLANTDITVAEAPLTEAVAPQMSVTGTVDGLTCYGMSLVFRSKIAVRIYFEGSIDDCTFKVGDTEVSATEKQTGLYYVEIADILPQDLEESVTVTVNDTLTVVYSPMNYMVRKGATGSDSLKALLTAMYNYHLSATAYAEKA